MFRSPNPQKRGFLLRVREREDIKIQTLSADQEADGQNVGETAVTVAVSERADAQKLGEAAICTEVRSNLRRERKFGSKRKEFFLKAATVGGVEALLKLYCERSESIE
ncbi:hypothetical protein NPIL_519271 [Nephila pilipes]|uniref:Uncharacterized protein n=1 Tax=Nephila pilipes TaxID=299642 RepID=A0A8X6NFX9_NEPPI|nr:hypothetical protein NPIL_519271 [Nephila pilipes]